MFGLSIGWSEIAVIAGFALMVLGPEKFPQVAKVAMKTFRDIRRYVNDAQRDIATELNPMKNELTKFSKIDIENYLENLMGDEKEPTNEIADDSSSDDDDVMLTPDEYDNPEEWFEQNEVENFIAVDDSDEGITGSEPIEESIPYHAEAIEEDESPLNEEEDA